MPRKRTVSDIKSTLLRPALTSDFEVQIALPTADGFTPHASIVDQDRMQLMCCDASLPGSNLATYDVNNDRHGVTERHAYRRVYDDRLDLTFYVDAQNYYPIRFFENWIDYIVDQQDKKESKAAGSSISNQSKNYFYRTRYYDEYVSEIVVTKFERDYNQRLCYKFLSAYPFSIQSMPISYESSGLLKCTVGFRYVRYIMDKELEAESYKKEPEEKRPAGNPAPKDGSAAAKKFFDDNKQQLIDDTSGTDFKFDPSKFGGGSTLTPNLNGDIA